MPVPTRPRRSLLYMPGSNPRALEKARELPADGLIFDLEDAVAPAAKEQARANVAAALAIGGYGRRELVLRVNGLDTAWVEADLAAAAAMPIDAVLLPKVENAATVHRALSRLDARGATERLRIWCMLETPLGILAAYEIAAASPRLDTLVLGTSDLTRDLHARHTPDRRPLLTAFGLAILAARAHRLAILDGVELDLSDDAGFAATCRQGRDLGFDGKTLIHPKQIAAANAAFGPSRDDIRWAQRVVAAYATAAAKDEGVALLDGRLIEALHVAEAQRLLTLAEEIEKRDREVPLTPAMSGG
jgi:citrate lyase subunit beta/citryl-CoA lyase